MKSRIIIATFVCIALNTIQLNAMDTQLVTRELIDVNRRTFSTYVEETIVPGVLSIAPSADDGVLKSLWKKAKRGGARAIGYSPLQIEGAKSIVGFCSPENIALRQDAVGQLGNNKGDAPFINDLLNKLDGLTGDPEALATHKVVIDYLLEQGVDAVTEETPLQKMVDVVPEINPEIMYPVFARQLFVQFWKRGKDLIFVVDDE